MEPVHRPGNRYELIVTDQLDIAHKKYSRAINEVRVI